VIRAAGYRVGVFLGATAVFGAALPFFVGSGQPRFALACLLGAVVAAVTRRDQ
jgi:hypothetical protein